MTRRVFVIPVAGALVLGAALALMTLSRTTPAPTDSRATRPSEGPDASRPVVTPSPAPTPQPAVGASASAPVRATEPRRRPGPANAASSAAAGIPDPDVVTLRVDSDIDGAQVFVDRNFVGTTPLTTTAVKPGSHRLNVSTPGYEGVAESLELTPGSRTVMVKLREVRLDATLAVVHKHRMGSCTGRLVATPQGIRYETTDRDDSFRSALADLDTFEVDYLAKNLRVKPRQGKQFDFTDPDGNADRLFVFHRDVDKARERLKRGDPPAAP